MLTVLFDGISIEIKRRMIDMGSKLSLYLLQNVEKCAVFA
jgi:hypothetical protein